MLLPKNRVIYGVYIHYFYLKIIPINTITE